MKTQQHPNVFNLNAGYTCPNTVSFLEGGSLWAKKGGRNKDEGLYFELPVQLISGVFKKKKERTFPEEI